jgi:cell shape-determining protein MreC
MKYVILVVLLLMIGCAPTEQLLNYDRESTEINRQVTLRIKTEKEYKKLYHDYEALKRRCETYQELFQLLQKRCGGISENNN